MSAFGFAAPGAFEADTAAGVLPGAGGTTSCGGAKFTSGSGASLPSTGSAVSAGPTALRAAAGGSTAAGRASETPAGACGSP
ncbi:MAG TPA: hypothetical protein VGY54_05810, partial [Polyangiaceae bacterium]|nr:hypothetical protein [Polyangiaceae bacterium]